MFPSNSFCSKLLHQFVRNQVYGRPNAEWNDQEIISWPRTGTKSRIRSTGLRRTPQRLPLTTFASHGTYASRDAICKVRRNVLARDFDVMAYYARLFFLHAKMLHAFNVPWLANPTKRSFI